MILHFSHIGLTDGRTFMGPFKRERTGARRARSAAGATNETSSGLAYASCQGVRTRGPSSVTAIVNSKWAASDPSCE
jgi:hypothetical protein